MLDARARRREATAMFDRSRHSLLFVPASNARAVAKARTLDCDVVILDLEDAVAADAKASAREAALEATQLGFGGRELAIRVNALADQHFAKDIAAVAMSAANAIVAPKVEDAAEAVRIVAAAQGKPVWAMIETPRGLLSANAIAAVPGIAALVVGTNDLAATLRLPAAEKRAGLTLALQTIVLAARAANILAFDGVYNLLDDEHGLAAEATEGRAFGFDGKTLIHPNQIAPVNRAFAPSEEELEDARALITAAKGGAERFRGRMVEAMHVAAAERLLRR